MNTTRLRSLVLLGLLACSRSFAADPPDRVNYQGVLRDAAGQPRDGDFDMTFRFFDALAGGNEILVDRHLAAGTGAVVVSGGLFDVALGSGAVTDGAAALPGDPYTTLAALFRDFTGVWMQIEIGAEVLSPRVQVVAAPYALHSRRAVSAGTADSALSAGNATTLGGLPASGYLNTSGTAQTKTGNLTVGALTANGLLTTAGRNINLGSPSALVQSDDNGIYVTGGDSAADSLFLNANIQPGKGSIGMFGSGAILLNPGNGQVLMSNASSGLPTMSVNPTGNVVVHGTLDVLGNNLKFGVPGATVYADADALTLLAGESDFDDLNLTAGNGTTDGGVFINGGAEMALVAGGGHYYFHKGGAGISTLGEILPNGDLTMTGDLIAEGGNVDLESSFPRIRATAGGPTTLTIDAGLDDTDTLDLKAGPSAGITLRGQGDLTIESSGGSIEFQTDIGFPQASLDPAGLFSVEQLKVLAPSASGGEIQVGHGKVAAFASQLQVVAGGDATDDLLLLGGNATGNGGIFILGDEGIELLHDAGAVTFRNASFAVTATLSNGGMFTAGNDLVALGNEVHLGAPGSVRLVRNPATDDVYIARDEDQNHLNSTFSIFTNIGVQQMRIGDGDEADALFDDQVVTNGIDYAEAFWITDASLAPGEVVMFDPERPGYIVRAAEAYSSRLAGVISTRPGFLTGGSFEAEEAADPALAQEMKAAYAVKDYAAAKEISLVLEQKKKEMQRPVALVGRLPVKVDASYGPIASGDHLTSSPTPGHAMVMREAGPSIGVALEAFDGAGTGTILAFVQRGHYTPTSLIAATQEAQAQLARTVATQTPDPATGVQVLPSSLQYVLDASGDEEARFSVFRDGEAMKSRAEVFRVDERGDVWAQGAFRPRSMDVAEVFELAEPAEPGDVVALDPAGTGRVVLARLEGDAAVAGVVAGDPGVILGADMTRLLAADEELAGLLERARAAGDRDAEAAAWTRLEAGFRSNYAPVALSGTVNVKVDADHGAIRPGDRLIASPTPGHAMRAPNPAPEGAVIGKAIGSLESGRGIIRMLVMLR